MSTMTAEEAFEAELERALDEKAEEAWSPEPGDRLLGSLVEIKETNYSIQDGSGLARLATIFGSAKRNGQRVDGPREFKVWLTSKLLRESWVEEENKGLAVGWAVGIAYEGEKKTQAGAKCHQYRVVSKPPDYEPGATAG